MFPACLCVRLSVRACVSVSQILTGYVEEYCMDYHQNYITAFKE